MPVLNHSILLSYSWRVRINANVLSIPAASSTTSPCRAAWSATCSSSWTTSTNTSSRPVLSTRMEGTMCRPGRMRGIGALKPLLPISSNSSHSSPCIPHSISEPFYSMFCVKVRPVTNSLSSIEMHKSSIAEFEWPGGSYWVGAKANK